MNIKISVIIPVYNCEKYIRSCVLSVENNHYSNTEIIIIDDGSTDGSYDICQKLANQYENIILLRQKNSGVSAARNNGLKHASGEIILFLDSDDLLTNGALTHYADIICKYDADIYITSYIKFGKLKHNKYMRNNRLYNGNELISSFPTIFLACQQVWCKAYKKTIIEENDLSFDDRFSFAEDALFNLHYLSFCKSALTSEFITYQYRKTSGGNNLSAKCKNVNEVYFEILKNANGLLSDRSDQKESNHMIHTIDNIWFYYCTLNYLSKFSDVDSIITMISELHEGFLNINRDFFADRQYCVTYSQELCDMINNKKIAEFVRTWKRQNGNKLLRLRNRLYKRAGRYIKERRS